MAKMLITPQGLAQALTRVGRHRTGYFDEVGLEYRFRSSPPEWDELRPGASYARPTRSWW